MVGNWQVFDFGNGPGADYEIRERREKKQHERKIRLNEWLEKNGFETVKYTIPHKGDWILDPGRDTADEDYPYYWCWCEDGYRECVCKNWQIIKLTECGNRERWTLQITPPPGQ